MNMLGLIDFEIVSLPAFEVVQRNIPMPVIPNEVGDGFEDSFDDIDYEVKKSPEKNKSIAATILNFDNADKDVATGKGTPPQKRSPRFGGGSSSVTSDKIKMDQQKNDEIFSPSRPNKKEIAAMGATGMGRPTTAFDLDEILSSEGDRPVTPVIAAPTAFSEDPEMKEFLEMGSGPAKRTAYRRDFYYDFKRYKTQRLNSLLQCPIICRRYVKEH